MTIKINLHWANYFQNWNKVKKTMPKHGGYIKFNERMLLDNFYPAYSQVL